MTTTKDPSSEHSDWPVNDHLSDPFAAAAGPAKKPVCDVESETLRLTVAHPGDGVCVIMVGGELDMCTAPLLEECLREQLAIKPKHLIVDLQSVCFLSSSGLHCLLRVRERALAGATQLHLAGLVTRSVVRILQVSQVLDLFSTYPTVVQALTEIID